MQPISQMKTQTAGAVRKPRLIFQLLIFGAVFVIASTIISFATSVPYSFWLLSNEKFTEACSNLDFTKLGELTEQLREIFSIAYDMPDWMLLLQLVMTVFEIAVPIFYCLKIEKRSLRSMGLTKEKALPKYLIGLLLGTAMLAATVGLTYLFGGAEIKLASDISVVTILVYFAAYIIQGAAEEILVRGYFMMSLTNGMHGKRKELWAVVISSAVFAILHVANPGITPLALFNLFLAGVMFAILALRTDNLLISCALHTAWNFVQGNVFGVSVSGMSSDSSVFVTTPIGSDLISGGTFGIEAGVAMTIVQIAVIGIILLVLPKRVAKQPPIESNDYAIIE